MKNRSNAVVLLLLTAACCFGQDDSAQAFTLGEELFMQNKPQEAMAYLEQAVTADPSAVKASLYLGIVYEQLDRADDAINIYRNILDQAGDLTANVANNIGNVYFKKGSIAEAESWYSQAIEANRSYAAAYLGRANVRLKAGSMREAAADYEQYVRLEPRARQKPDIERLVAYIKAEIAEAERRQRLKDEVSASLQSAADASQGLSSGAEDVEGYAGEFELE